MTLNVSEAIDLVKKVMTELPTNAQAVGYFTINADQTFFAVSFEDWKAVSHQ